MDAKRRAKHSSGLSDRVALSEIILMPSQTLKTEGAVSFLVQY